MVVLFGWEAGWFGISIGALIIGIIIGFFATRKLIASQMKKNPPINENMIRAMFRSMGRKPSEAQIRAVMKSMQDANNQ